MAISKVLSRQARIFKHMLFQYLPGRIGVRNRACYRHLTRETALKVFEDTLSRMGPDAICIDCGANQGVVTRRLAEKAGKVYAFEPDPWTAQRLRENVGHLSNVEIFEKAVGGEAGLVTMFRAENFGENPEAASLATSIYSRSNSDIREKYEVECVDLVKFIRHLDAEIALIKVDIEGAEVTLLERLLADDVASRIELMLVETHELQFSSLLMRTEALRERVANLKKPVVNLDWH